MARGTYTPNGVVSQLALKRTKLTFAFSAGWLWIPLLLAALIAAETAALALAVAFGVAGLFALACAIALSFVRGTGVRLAALAGLALGVVLVSALLPVTVPSNDPYTEIGFGYPVHFVFADLSSDSGHQPLPYATTEHWNPWEQTAVVDVLRFLFSYLAVLAALMAISLGARGVWQWLRQGAAAP